MSTIYLIRHGRTEANDRHLYCGSTDLPLSEEGEAALREQHYSIIGPVDYVTSGMQRTERTMEILFGSVPHTQEPEFREIDFGIFEMQGYDQLKDDPVYQQWLSGDNDANVPPRGESGRQMSRRVMEAFRRYAALNRDLVIVTHGGVIASIMEQLFPGEQKNRYQWQPRPGFGYAVENNTYWEIP